MRRLRLFGEAADKAVANEILSVTVLATIRNIFCIFTIVNLLPFFSVCQRKIAFMVNSCSQTNFTNFTVFLKNVKLKCV